MKYQDIYQFITGEEANYKLKISITDNWEWNMADHIKTAISYKNSKFTEGVNGGNRPFKNIVRPILNLQYRAEGFDVKDIVLFIDDAYAYFKSFLVRKYHEKWARENGIDTFIDQLVESFVDFGAALVKNVRGTRPEVVPMQRIAFCDQTDILAGPIGEKHFYSPAELQDMGGKWKNIDRVIAMAEFERSNVTGKQAKTPGKYIEVYEVHGTLPKAWLEDDANYQGAYYDQKAEDYVPQVQICTFYQDEQGEKKGITLFKSQEAKSIYKILLRDEIYGRGLGLGGVEEIEDPQVWVNYDMIRIKDLKDAASKILLKTTDPSVTARHPSGLKDLENLEIIEVRAGADIGQIDTFPRNLKLFEDSIANWEAEARQMGAANESILGESPTSGTPFKLQELITAESHSLHEYRKGKIAIFVDELYREWILPHIAREIANGKTFLSELSLEELQKVADNLVICEVNKWKTDKVLNGETWQDAEAQVEEQKVRDAFMKGGNQRFIEILKNELKNVPLSIRVSINSKQKDLPAQTDKLTNIFRTISANPQILENPAMAKLFNQILESSNLDPLDFSGFTSQAPTLAESSFAPRVILNQLPGQPNQPVANQPQPNAIQPR